MASQHRKERKTRWETPVTTCLLLAGLSVTVLGDTSSFSDFHFVVEPSDTVVVKGSPTVLNCVTQGRPPPKIEWKREGMILQFIDDSRSVYHTRTERPDEGLYQCLSSIEEIGTIVSRTAKLQVASLPRFDEQPQDVVVLPGQTAYFPCVIQGNPPATVSWQKNEQPLQINSSRMLVLPSGALEIKAVNIEDEGRYRCNASNIDKYRISAEGLLSVSLHYFESYKTKTPEFIVTPKNTIVAEGSNVTLDCAANGSPLPHITWLKDGVTIEVNRKVENRFKVLGVGSLEIRNIQEDDEGIYMCRAENHVDSTDVSATVEVQVPPKFVKKPHNRYAYEKEDIEFECEIYGKPEATVQWIKNGELIIQSEYFQIVNGYNLRILGLVRSDQGMYQCVGRNPAGNIQASVQLIILDPNSPHPTHTTHTSVTIPHMDVIGDQPLLKEVPTSPQRVTAVIVSTRFVTLSWQEPVLTNGLITAYSVYYKGEGSSRERVVNTTVARLREVSIQGLRPSTQYIFRVIAYNQHGPGSSSDEIRVETHAEVHVPGPPKNLRALSTSPTSIKIQWHAPDKRNGPIEKYKLYYMEAGTSTEHQITTTETNYIIRHLKKFTEYSFWVVAINKNGPGVSTDEVSARTYSDTPSETPQNVSVEASSSTSLIVRWEPPPKESRNGIITGYKIRYKAKGSRRGETVTTDGNRRLYALTDLERGGRYSVKIAALSVNGSGPSTQWFTVDTYENDLDESIVPDRPKSLRARPSATSIFVSWTPPRNQNVMIRGYTIGWGVGFPDVYTKVLNGKQRHYTIENLQPSSEYVISLRAFNQVGDGRPIYETVRTHVKSTPEPLIPMLPPVGLKAIVLSPTTVVLYWTDTTLPRNQIISDNRFYTVRYTPFTYDTPAKSRFYNSTDLNCMIDDLKPNTQYEFSVKVILGQQESTWSMTAFNTTQEAAPSTPPRDLTLVPSEDDPSVVNLHWQPPKQPNGLITGYVVFYTTDNTKKDINWVVEGVVGDKMTTTLKGLTPATTYYFKIQARNNKGYGPFSAEVVYMTEKSATLSAGSKLQENGSGLTNTTVHIIIVCVSVFTLLFIMVVSVMICRRQHDCVIKPTKKGGGGKTTAKGKDIKPPDLWIHHDQMEPKTSDKQLSAEAPMTDTPIPRNSQDLGDETVLETLDGRKGSYLDPCNNLNDNLSLHHRAVRAKPIMIPVDSQVQLKEQNKNVTLVGNGTLNQHYDSLNGEENHSFYPRKQYTNPRPHLTVDCNLKASSDVSSSPASTPPVKYDQLSTRNPSTYNSTVGTSDCGTSEDECRSSGSIGRGHIGHPLRSFSGPEPEPPTSSSSPSTTQPTIVVRPIPSTSPLKTDVPSNTGLSDCKTTTSPHFPSLNVRPGPAATNSASKPSKENKLLPSYSTEELNQEMANLEGLMKDLNAITAMEFECSS
ncbi:neogenin-like isoform X3 [Tachypleus tridentatus]|uniref:neogenin-like isoform X3 n=1 Tax=Tachypleus tridentatus TaxID=6853 RepID=UPI003FD21200